MAAAAESVASSADPRRKGKSPPDEFIYVHLKKQLPGGIIDDWICGLKRDTKFRSLFADYYRDKEEPIDDRYEFVYDGRRLKEDATPAMVGMDVDYSLSVALDDEVVIDVMKAFLGGGAGF